jgi:hypothetical protein
MARKRSLALAGIPVVVAALPILIGALIGSEGGRAAVLTSGYTPVRPPAVTGPAPTRASPIPGGSGALVALVHHATTLRSAPGGKPLHQLGTHTEFGSPEVMWVVNRVPGWLGVISTLAGNGQVGWIAQSAASLGRVPWELKVALSARTLTVIDHGTVVQRYTVAVGAPYAPTPTGRFSVTDRLTTGDPAGPYGCCILALSAHSPHSIQGWTGGNRIAIHSTPETASIGQAASHGCLRLTIAEGRWLINHVPLGTPTLISS